MILTYTWLAVAITTLVLYLRQVYTKLSRNGVSHRPIVPFFGHLFWVFFKEEHIIDCLMKSINAFPDDKVVGHYDMTTPVMIVHDMEMIKKVTIKDFEYFVDRRGFTSKYDPMFGRGLLLLNGDEWKAMRSTMSPAFTSSKIRLMVPFMVDVGTEMIKVLRERIKDSGHPYIDVEAKDMATRYANDVIASCAFGLKVDSQTEDNQFYVNSKFMTRFSFLRLMKVFLYRCMPSVAQMLKLSLVRRETSEFFTDVVLSTMKNREENNIVRNDMINILMEVKKGQLKHETEHADTDAGFATVEESSIGKKQHNFEWTDTDLVAQAALFLFAGFDTVSTVMSFLLYELAMNPDVQERLVQEIREHDAKNGGKFDYDSIQHMSYLDMVVSEGLRLWPPAPFMDRRCVKDYNFGKPNNKATKDLIIRKDDIIILPIWAFHRDPKLYPEPLKFDPERFSPENRDKINPFTYMPFGIGPRNCIGSRFALCEVKVMVYQLLREMEVYPFEKTSIPPVKLSKDGFNMKIRDGAWVRLRVRTEK